MSVPNERIERIFEMDLKEVTERQIATLLDQCFPETFDGRSYYKQVPHARLLLRRGRSVIGHAGLDHRVIRVGDAVVRIVGIVDLCVAPDEQHHGRGSDLLQCAERIAIHGQAQQLILFADRSDLYLRNGYRLVAPAMITWLAVDEQASHSLQRRDFSGTLLSKPVAGNPFPTGDIDLLGYLF